jgi:hypothetical protein
LAALHQLAEDIYCNKNNNYFFFSYAFRERYSDAEKPATSAPYIKLINCLNECIQEIL